MDIRDKATEIALANPTELRAKMAAIIYRRSEILGVGQNKKKSHPLQGKYKKNNDAIFLHAEIAALVDALRKYGYDDVVGANIIVCRVLRCGDLALAKPCLGCFRALSAFDIYNIQWSTDGGWDET